MSEEKTCKNCGKQINEKFKLCPYCGANNEEELEKNKFKYKSIGQSKLRK